jgi:hypothetical protein
MLSSLPDLQKERGFPHPSRKKKLLKFKRESTRGYYVLVRWSHTKRSRPRWEIRYTIMPHRGFRRHTCATGPGGRESKMEPSELRGHCRLQTAML